jgi:hypothetical protein
MLAAAKPPVQVAGGFRRSFWINHQLLVTSARMTKRGLSFRKDIELLRCDFHSAASHSEAQRLCPPFSEMQSSRIVPLASAPAGCAVPYSTTRDHCGALKRLSRKSLDPVGHHIAVTDPAYGFALGCACPSFPHRLRVWFGGECDHLRRPRSAFGRSDPAFPLGKPDAPLRARRSSRNGSRQTQSTARMNRSRLYGSLCAVKVLLGPLCAPP